MIFQGRYENDAGIFRPYISADVLSLANEWVTVDFLVVIQGQMRHSLILPLSRSLILIPKG